jgi:hypothetical protein
VYANVAAEAEARVDASAFTYAGPVVVTVNDSEALDVALLSVTKIVAFGVVTVDAADFDATTVESEVAVPESTTYPYGRRIDVELAEAVVTAPVTVTVNVRGVIGVPREDVPFESIPDTRIV